MLSFFAREVEKVSLSQTIIKTVCPSRISQITSHRGRTIGTTRDKTQQRHGESLRGCTNQQSLPTSEPNSARFGLTLARTSDDKNSPVSSDQRPPQARPAEALTPSPTRSRYVRSLLGPLPEPCRSPRRSLTCPSRHGGIGTPWWCRWLKRTSSLLSNWLCSAKSMSRTNTARFLADRIIARSWLRTH